MSSMISSAGPDDAEIEVPHFTADGDGEAIPFITAAQMREVDRLMTEHYGIQLTQMMENAGRNLARAARALFFEGSARHRDVAVLCGAGGNGGGGLVAARRLMSWGANVTIWLSRPLEGYQGVPALQLHILQAMQAELRYGEAPLSPEPDLILDALIGYSLSGAPTGRTAQLIQAANSSAAPVLSLDVPSGMDATTGEVHEPAARAEATLTLALPKSGLRAKGTEPYVGDLYLADIGVPPELYRAPSLGVQVCHLFHRREILRIRRPARL